MSLSRAEKETIVRWSEDPEEDMTVFTHSKLGRDKMKRAGAKLIRTNSINGVDVAWTFKCPREWFRWPGRKRVALKRGPLSEEAKAALRERLSKARSHRITQGKSVQAA